MAINETILGPNSSLFTFGAGETQATFFAAVDQYATAHGWEVHDANPGTALSGGTGLGRVYRALQDGSTTVYKYFALHFSGTNTTKVVYAKVYESWNAVTHVGINEANSVNGSSNLYTNTNTTWDTEGAGFVLFVNKKWFAIRARANTFVYDTLIGAFEIKKDYNEPESLPSVVLMSNYMASGSLASSGSCFFGSPRNSKGAVGAGAHYPNTITTPFGAIGKNNSSSYDIGISNITPAVVPNGTMTMVAAEHRHNTAYGLDKLRGRIMGIKMVYGAVQWNDMDKTQVATDSEFFQNPGSTLMDHHIVLYVNGPQSMSFVRFVLPV